MMFPEPTPEYSVVTTGATSLVIIADDTDELYQLAEAAKAEPQNAGKIRIMTYDAAPAIEGVNPGTPTLIALDRRSMVVSFSQADWLPEHFANILAGIS